MKKKKQEELPAMIGDGVELKMIPAIEQLASEYVEIRDERVALTQKENEAKARLLAAMHDHNVMDYKYDDYQVFVTASQETVIVKRNDGDGIGME